MQDDTRRPGDEGGEANGSQADENDAQDRDPFRSHLSDVQDLVTEFVSGFRGFPYGGARYPRYDMVRTESEYTILMDVPGVPKDKLDVNAVGDELTISGDRPRPTIPEGAEVVRTERGSGSFRRTMRLPADVDVAAVRAKLDSGVLRVTLPRRGGAGKKTIDIEE